jgi:multiple sugar transport system substrate-binding protein
MRRLILSLSAATLALGVGGNIATAQESIDVWWTKPDYQQDEDKVLEIAKRFTDETGIAVTVSFFSSGDLNTKTPAAVEAGDPPDAAFGTSYDAVASPKWAYEDKLVELTDIVAGREAEFYEPALTGATFFNNTTGKRALYAFPLGQNLRNFNYWKTMLAEAGKTEADIPKDWDGFWEFWCGDVQTKLQDAGQRVNAVGQAMSGNSNSADVYFPFFVELSAYNVNWITPEGKLLIDDPKVRDGFITAVKHWASLYERGCVPDSVTTWTNEDNNTYFHNKSIAITSVASSSIVNRYLDDKEPDVYYKETGTLGYPNGADGQPVANPSQTRSMVVFKDADNAEAGKKFVAFFSKVENMQEYNDASFGQVFPSLKAVGESAFWTNKDDPHRYSAYLDYQDKYKAGKIERFPNHYNYKLSAANAENVWGRAMGRVLVDKWEAEKAVDELFARLKELTK